MILVLPPRFEANTVVSFGVFRKSIEAQIQQVAHCDASQIQKSMALPISFRLRLVNIGSRVAGCQFRLSIVPRDDKERRLAPVARSPRLRFDHNF